jgi:hypothetical protein
MLNPIAWLRHLPYPAICLSFSATLSAAEAPAEQAAGGVARTARPGCAKLVCQPRGPAADLDAGAERPESGETASTVAIRWGLGAGAFRFPKVQVSWETVTQSIGETSELVLGPPMVEERDVDIEGAALSLGVSLEQPLASSSALRWSLEERLSFVAVLPLEGGSLVGGFVDVLVGARMASLPVRLGVGPSLGVALLETNDDLLYLEEPAVMVGGAAVLALDLGALLPGTLELVGHYGTPLTYDDASHRDLQLAFAVPL